MKKTSLLLSILIATSSVSSAEIRYTGWFDEKGKPISMEVNTPLKGPFMTVRPGHTVATLPNLPAATLSRLGNFIGGALAQDPDVIIPVANDRFAKSVASLRKKNIIQKAKKAAATFGVDPAVLIGNILGELTFNNDVLRLGQDWAGQLLPSKMNYAGAQRLNSVINSKPFEMCKPHLSDYWSWVCVNQVWGASLSKAKKRPEFDHIPNEYIVPLDAKDDVLHGVLRPSTGGSYGLAQMSLVRALMVSKDVADKTAYKEVHLQNMSAVMELVLDDEATLYILAASAARAIDAYKRFANIDISNNVGIQVTLFNLGYEVEKALELQRTNYIRNLSKQKPLPPKENYMGWFITEKEAEIRQLLAE